MIRTVFVSVVLGFAAQYAQAQDACPTSFSNYQDVIKCAELRSPEAQQAILQLEQARNNIGAQGQWKNPELSVDSYDGKFGGQKRSETELALSVPIEIGKVSARKAIAAGDADMAAAALFEAKTRVRSEVILKLHRLRQAGHELEVIDESIGTFGKLVSQYGRRPKLAPEQALSVSVYKMAKSEYDLKRIEVFDELAALDTYFEITIGKGSEALKKVLPPSPKTWPKVAGPVAVGNSAKSKMLDAELKRAQAELSLARSESWPTVSLGPSVRMQKEGSTSDQMMGFNVSLPLPLFNLNGGARATALAGVKASEHRKSFGRIEEDQRRQELVRTYEHSLQVLGTTLSHQEIERKHSESEQLFLRGIVPSSLVIESHRTFVELERSRNSRELKAIETLLNIYAYDGKSLENL